MREKKRLDMQIEDLSDRQSVRTTLRFSQEALEALGWLSERYGVTMKDVLHSALERLIEHKASESTNGHREENELSKDLGVAIILSNFEYGMKSKKSPEKTVRRTVVVTKKTLRNLKKLSEQHKITRDELINNAIIFAKSLRDKFDEVEIKTYQEAQVLIDKFYLEAQGTEFILKELLGEDDPIVDEMSLAVSMIMNTYSEIEEEIRKRNKVNYHKEQKI